MPESVEPIRVLLVDGLALHAIASCPTTGGRAPSFIRKATLDQGPGFIFGV